MTDTAPVHRIRSFARHYRQRYGQPVGKVPLDLGIPCPNRRRGGCIFCAPQSFTPLFLDGTEDLSRQLARGRSQCLRRGCRLFFAYFQQETTTALASHRLLPHFEAMLAENGCVGLIISTRPDAVEDDLLAALARRVVDSGKECLFELGLQSIHAQSLALLNRNHDAAAFIDAVRRIRQYGCYQVSAHLILGIPGETAAMMRTTVDGVCGLGVDALKLHHLQVIRDTPLAAMFQRGTVGTLGFDAYLELLLDLLPRIPERIVLHRLCAHAPPHLLLAPRWGVLAAELSERLHELMRAKGLCQGSGIREAAGSGENAGSAGAAF